MPELNSAPYSYLDAMDDLRGMTVVHGEFVLVTSDSADCAAYAPFSALLARVKASLGMAVVFVSQALEGIPVPRPNRRGAAVGCDAAEVDYGHAMLDLAGASAGARSATARLSAPVADGSFTYGTLCCASRGPVATRAEQDALRTVAQMMANALGRRTPRPALLN